MNTMYFPSVLRQPFAWPVDADTPVEHISVLGFLTEEEHLSLVQSGMSLTDISETVGLRIERFTTHRSVEWYRDVRDCVRFLAATGWDKRASNAILSLSEHGYLENYEWTPEQARAVAAASLPEGWVDEAWKMSLGWDEMARYAADSLPIEYLRALKDG